MGLGWLRPYVMLVRINVTIELSNVNKKKTIECDRNTVICDDGTIKNEKKN